MTALENPWTKKPTVVWHLQQHNKFSHIHNDIAKIMRTIVDISTKCSCIKWDVDLKNKEVIWISIFNKVKSNSYQLNDNALICHVFLGIGQFMVPFGAIIILPVRHVEPTLSYGFNFLQNSVVSPRNLSFFFLHLPLIIFCFFLIQTVWWSIWKGNWTEAWLVVFMLFGHLLSQPFILPSQVRI